MEKSLKRIMDTTLDICMVKKVKETIISHGIAKRLSANKLQEKESSMDVHLRPSVMNHFDN